MMMGNASQITNPMRPRRGCKERIGVAQVLRRRWALRIGHGIQTRKFFSTSAQFTTFHHAVT